MRIKGGIKDLSSQSVDVSTVEVAVQIVVEIWILALDRLQAAARGSASELVITHSRGL